MLTYNVKLEFNSKEHQCYWEHVLKTTTFAYNDMSKMIFESKCPLSLKRVHGLVYDYCRKKYPTIPAQAIVKIYKDVISNIRASKRKSYPIRTKFSMRLDCHLYSCLTATSIKLPSSKSHVRNFVRIIGYKKFYEFCSKYKMCDPIIFIRNGSFFLNVTFVIPEKPVVGEDRLGVDLGIRRVFTTSDGIAYSGSDLNRIKRKLRYNKRKLQSKGTKSAKRKLKKLRHKERNINKNYTHLICNKILDTDKSIIILEDLTGIKEKTKKTKNGYKRTSHNNRISQIPFYMIRFILTYKAPMRGKRVETVSPSFTSQINSLTGKKDGERKGCRYYTKKLVLDADWNAAINIAKRYSRHSQSFDTPIDGKLKLLRQAVSQPANSGNESYSQITNA